MNITVRLFATLRENRGKVLDMEVPASTCVSDVLRTLDISREEVTILLVNGRDGKIETQLADGDTISLFPPVGGG